MSYSADIKKELCAVHTRPHKQRLCELSGLTFCCGTIRVSKNLSVVYRTEQMTVAKHIASLGASFFSLDVTMELKTLEHRKRPLIEVVLDGANVLRMLTEIGLLSESEGGLHALVRVPTALLDTEECARAFVRGCFLGSGICLDPKRRYHLEIICQNAVFSRDLMLLLTRYDIAARPTQRQNRFVLYTKDGDSVMRFLALLGANVAAMEFENVRAEKETRNYANRTTNCDTANLEKSAVASARQLAAISRIMRHAPLQELPPSLCEAAELRINNPEASLIELADLAGIKKSGMNHRLQRLMLLAEELGQ